MDEKDKIDSYIKLAELIQSVRNTRYQNQIRITVVLWATLAASAIYLKTRPPELMFDLVLVAIIIGHIFAISRAQLHNYRDSVAMTRWLIEAENALLGHPQPIVEISWKGGVNQAITVALWSGPTVLLATIAYLVAGTH